MVFWSLDLEFDAAVKQWERRLGELNVMVEAVEPPAEVWDKIKGEIGAEMPGEADAAADTESVPDLESPATVDATDFLFAETATTQPDENAGEAAATTANDAAAPPADDDLVALAREHLAPYKVPVRFVTIDELPRNEVGKVLGPHLVALAALA